MSVETVLLVAVAIGFALVSGVNDGGALVGLSLKVPSIRPVMAALLAAGGLVVGTLLLGTTVATTVASRLVPFQEGQGAYALVVAVGAAVAVVAGLSRVGLPTSLTLAVVGGIAGAGMGFGLPVSWGTVALVLVVGAAAPALGLALGLGLARALVLVPPSGRAVRRINAAHRGVFALLCLAYSVNDGQKMLAIFAVAFATADPVVEPRVDQLLAISALFLVGAVVGLRPIGGTLGSGVLLSRPLNVVTAELSAATAVLGSTALGSPVSMTQSITAGLVGSGVSEGYGKIRWRVAAQIVTAWVVTLPAAVALAATVGAAVRGVIG